MERKRLACNQSHCMKTEDDDISLEDTGVESEKASSQASAGSHYSKYEAVGSDGALGWGAPYFAEDEWLPVAQVLAAVTMLGPVGVEYLVAKINGCETDLFSLRPVGTGVLAYAILLPGSISSHLSCAVYRRWVPRYQKADRIGVAISVIFQCWACSQNVVYTVIGAVLGISYIALITCGLRYFQLDSDTASLMVGAFVTFGLCSMQIPLDWQDWRFNPYFVLAAAALFAGFAIFVITPVRSWTDAVWHGFLTLYALSTSFWTIKLERDMYQSCSQ